MIGQKIRAILYRHLEYSTGESVDEITKEILAALQPEEKHGQGLHGGWNFVDNVLQPKGELADCPKFNSCTYNACMSCEVYEAIKSQRLHDELTMVELPSEDELTLMLQGLGLRYIRPYGLGDVAKELHRLLKKGK